MIHERLDEIGLTVGFLTVGLSVPSAAMPAASFRRDGRSVRMDQVLVGQRPCPIVSQPLVYSAAGAARVPRDIVNREALAV